MEKKDNNLKDINFLAVKGQRLSRAIYLVSSFVPDQDPLKWKIRERAIELLTDAKNLGQGLAKNDPKKYVLESNIILNKLNGHLDQLVSLMDLAVAGGSISEMNFAILKQETSVLLEAVSLEIKEASFANYLGSPVLPDEIKTVNGIPVAGISQQVSSNNGNGHNFFNNHSDPNFHLGQTRSNGQISNGQKLAKTTVSNGQIRSLNGASSAKSENKDLRKKTILDFVKGKSWTSIKDIATAVHGCGEKTVQRLLVEMVEEGHLKKQGERRWSRYMVN